MSRCLDMFAFRSQLVGNTWPALLDAGAARLAALLWQLERSQWLPAKDLARRQFEQLSNVVAHAARTVPAYRSSLAPLLERASAGALTGEDWSSVEPITRAQVQKHADGMLASTVPDGHGPIGWVKTSGSTGIPLRVATTALTRLVWDALTVRDHLWHRREFGSKLGAIRFLGDEKLRGAAGVVGGSWGPPVDHLFVTGPMAALHIENDVSIQLDWLERERPDLLLTYPSNAAELVREAGRQGRALTPVKELRLFSEVVDADTRDLLREAFAAPVSETYSTNECGYVALECEEGRLHVQAESVLVEVVDDAGRPCAPGETGRVLLSTLHNFAMPLLRYESGDHAEVASPCACGRGLPALARILGRTRNMLVSPDGRRHWPVIGFGRFREIAPVVQHQLVQSTPRDIEVRLVVERPVTADEEARLKERPDGQSKFPHLWPPQIPPGKTGRIMTTRC